MQHVPQRSLGLTHTTATHQDSHTPVQKCQQINNSSNIDKNELQNNNNKKQRTDEPTLASAYLALTDLLPKSDDHPTQPYENDEVLDW
jgi:hypothetical protein